jgi:hypothetical protein
MAGWLLGVTVIRMQSGVGSLVASDWHCPGPWSSVPEVASRTAVEAGTGILPPFREPPISSRRPKVVSCQLMSV